MKRRDFVRSCGGVSAGAVGMATVGTAVLSGCKSTPEINSRYRVDEQGRVAIPIGDFTATQSFQLIAQPDSRYPVCVNRHGLDDYTASLMSCTHLACETAPLQGGFVCPCHGARYNARGQVTRGPAQEDLKTYPVSVRGDFVIVDLS